MVWSNVVLEMADLEAELCLEIETHMSECENCRIVVDTLRKTVVLYRTRGQAEVPDDVRSRLYAVLDLEALAKGHS